MSTLKKLLFLSSLLLFAETSLGAHFVRIIRPALTETIGKDESLFMSKFSGRYYENYPDNTKVALACSNGTFTIGEKERPANTKTCRAYYGTGVKYINFSPSGNKLVTTSTAGTVKVWDLDCNLLAEFDDPLDAVHLATFGKDDDEIFTNSKEEINKLWTLKVDESKLLIVCRYFSQLCSY
jgi:WD40 repeat protein